MATAVAPVTPMTPLKYVMGELGIKAADWSKLSQADKDWLKNAAAAEMAVVGQVVA